MKTLNLALLVIGLITRLALAGNEGGGGGAICTPAKCITLAEAGLRLDIGETKRFKLSVEQVKDLAQVINLIPIDFDKKEFKKKILGKASTYLVAQEEDQHKFEKFKAEYESILKNSGYAPSEQAGFQLAAATVRNETYILPGFEKMDLRSRSLILIHEGLIRSFGASVPEALAFDGHLIDLLKVTRGEANSSMNYLEMLELMENLKLVKGSYKKKMDKDVLERRIIDGNLEILKLKRGTVLKHSNCMLQISQALPGAVAEALIKKGYLIVASQNFKDGDLLIRNLGLEQKVLANGCLDSRLSGFIEYLRGSSSINIAGGISRRSCQEIWPEVDAEKLATELFPQCQIHQEIL